MYDLSVSVLCVCMYVRCVCHAMGGCQRASFRRCFYDYTLPTLAELGV